MLTNVIPAYAYWQYSEDPDIQAFFQSFNEMAQSYVDFLNSLGLAVYTSSVMQGALLDWTARGIYNIKRGSLPGGNSEKIIGTVNTSTLNSLALNSRKNVATPSYYAITDDIFKRIITWNTYKGDGLTFSIRWLKRRVLRFLTGVNGTDPGIDQTYQVSVSFGINRVVNINIRSQATTVIGGAGINRRALNTVALNSVKVRISSYSALPATSILASAIQAQLLKLPFQYTYQVNAI